MEEFNRFRQIYDALKSYSRTRNDLRIVRTLAVGYKREFASCFGFSPEVGHRSPAPAAGFPHTVQQCEH